MPESAPSFEQVAVARGFLSREQLQEAREIQRKVIEAGLETSIEEVCLKKGFLSPQQLAVIHAVMGKGQKLVIQGYEILGKIGQGGMGAVFKARQTSMDRIVAIKTLLPHFAREPNAVERFLREAKVLAKLNHPNIVAGIDAGFQSGVYYYVMEYVEGRDLKSMLREQKRLPWKEALRITRLACEALQYAQAAGIVHRDIKPDNIIVTHSGDVKVTDMGLAKVAGGPVDATLTQSGYIMGTPAYMSPEQAQGNKEIDIRSDIYSLGLTLFEMLSGYPAYSGESPIAVLSKRLTQDPAWDRLATLGIPEPVLALGRRMTVRDRARRYQKPADVIHDIRLIEAGRAPVATAPVSPDRTPTRRLTVPPKRRSNMPLVAAILAAAVMIAGALIYVMSNSTRETIVRAPVHASPPPESQLPPAVSREDPYAALREEIEGARKLEREQPGALEDILDYYRKLQASTSATPFASEVIGKVKEYEGRLDEAIRKKMDEARARFAAASEKKTFGEFLRYLQSVEGEFRSRDWSDFVKDQRSSLEARVTSEFNRVEAAVREALDRADFEAARKTIEILKSWGLPKYEQLAEVTLGQIGRAERDYADLLERESAAYAEDWQRAVSLMRGRKYGEAVQVLQEARSRARHHKTKELIDRHIADFGKVSTVHEIAGTIQKPDPTVKEILEEYRKSNPDEHLAMFLYALFSADYPLARAEGDRLRTPLPAEYQSILQELAEAHANREQREQAATKLYNEANRIWGTNPPEASRMYRELLEKFYDTQVVSRNRKAIEDRSKVGVREAVFFPADRKSMKGLWKEGEYQGKKVLLTENRGEFGGPEDYVEYEFYAEKDVKYHLWIRMSYSDRMSNCVYVQIDGDAVDPQTGGEFYRVGTDRRLFIQYWPHRDHPPSENGICWGWQDRDGLRGGSPPAEFAFKTSGLKRLRIYCYEDGTMISQIVLSSGKYTSGPPVGELSPRR